MSPAREIFVPQRIISGGQTGVDRGALDAAANLGIAHGGWCPRGRIAEDGVIPDRYELWEHDSAQYSARTLQNVVDSDATLILYADRLQGGTKLTLRYVKEQSKPHFTVRLGDEELDLRPVRDWLSREKPEVLNIAGPRGSNFPGIEEASKAYLLGVFGEMGSFESSIHLDWGDLSGD